MQIVKQNVARDIPCILVDNTDGYTPDTGVAAGSVTINYRKEGASSWTSKTATGNWTEVGKGIYLISWSTSDLNTIGRFDFIVEVSGDINYPGSLVVSANLLDDIDTTIDALNDLAQSDILSDATTFAGANVNATISSRSSHTANDARDAILSDSTPFAGANIDAAITSRSSHAAADVVALMNDLTVAEIVDGVWDELKSAHTTADSFGDYLDDEITSRSSHSAADVVALMNDLDASEILAAITTDSTKFAGALIANLDAAISTRSSHTAANVDTQLSGTHGSGSWEGGAAAPTVAEIVDGVWDELKSAHTTPDSFGDYLDDEITSRSSHTAADVVALMNDLDATEILAAITTDSTKFAGANIDAAITSRSSHTANNVRDAILSDSTPFDGADIDTAVSTRSSHTAANVDTQLSGTHGAGNWEGGGAAPTVAEIADGVWDETAGDHTGAGSFGKYLNDLNTNVDVVLSTRSSHSAADVDTTLTASHGAGSWTSSSPPSAAVIADAVWDEAAGDHTGAGSFGESIDTLTTNIDVVLSTRSSHDAADVDTTLTASHGAGSWAGSSAADVADAVWDEAAADHTAAGSFGEAIDILTTNIDVVLSTRSSHDAADVDTQLSGVHGAGSWEGGGAAPTVGEIADAVWDEIASGHVGAGSFGEAIDTLATNIDVVLSTRSSHSAADVDTQLSGVHGAGSWEGGGAAPTVSEIADAVLEELIADHTSISGSLADVIDEIHNYHLSPGGHVEWE